jgi:hypothetical protein
MLKRNCKVEKTPTPIGAKAGYAHGGTLGLPQPNANLPFVLSTVRRRYWTSALRVLAIELHNLVHRIQWALEIRAWELGGYKAPLPTLWGVAPVRPCSHYRHAYIRYTQTLLDRHPFLSTVDLSLAGEGWKDGWECSALAGTTHGQPKIHRCSRCNSWRAILRCP